MFIALPLAKKKNRENRSNHSQKMSRSKKDWRILYLDSLTCSSLNSIHGGINNTAILSPTKFHLISLLLIKSYLPT